MSEKVVVLRGEFINFNTPNGEVNFEIIHNLELVKFQAHVSDWLEKLSNNDKSVTPTDISLVDYINNLEPNYFVYTKSDWIIVSNMSNKIKN